jgi:superfamily I DNA and/or RNA helicase
MHPVLGDLVSRNFYQGKLKSQRPAEEFAHNLPGYNDAVAAWISVPPERGLEIPGRSKLRPVEAVRVADEVARLLHAAPDLTVGVISFYSAQVTRIWQELASRHHLARPTEDGYAPEEELEYDSAGRRLDRLKVGTVDAFQGKQFDVVFLSVTRCGPPRVKQPEPTDAAYTPWVRQRYGHLTLRNRLCVAMSRQKRLLVAVGADAMFDPAPAEVTPLGDLLRLCKQRGGHGVFIPR